jgi:hypothetical protein
MCTASGEMTRGPVHSALLSPLPPPLPPPVQPRRHCSGRPAAAAAGPIIKHCCRRALAGRRKAPSRARRARLGKLRRGSCVPRPPFVQLAARSLQLAACVREAVALAFRAHSASVALRARRFRVAGAAAPCPPSCFLGRAACSLGSAPAGAAGCDWPGKLRPFAFHARAARRFTCARRFRVAGARSCLKT